MCATARREGIKFKIGNLAPYSTQEGIKWLPWLNHVRSETMRKVLDNPKIFSWEHVDLPWSGFAERTLSDKNILVPFFVPAGKVIGGVLIKNQSFPQGQLAVLTRETTKEEHQYAKNLGHKGLNGRMPVIRKPISHD